MKSDVLNDMIDRDPSLTLGEQLDELAIIANNSIDALAQANQELSFQAAQVTYIARGGVSCLACDSDQLEGGSIEVSAGIAWQRVTCLKCYSEWVDNYKLVDADNFEKGEELQP